MMYNISEEAKKQVLYNLRKQYPKLAHITDKHILEQYEEYSMSEEDISFIDWCEGIDE